MASCRPGDALARTVPEMSSNSERDKSPPKNRERLGRRCGNTLGDTSGTHPSGKGPDFPIVERAPRQRLTWLCGGPRPPLAWAIAAGRDTA